jgi:hypothetical protein
VRLAAKIKTKSGSIAIAAAALAGCATTAALDSRNADYRRGVESYAAGNCEEALAKLEAFIETSCSGEQPVAGCQRASWTRMLCYLRDDRPGDAVLSYDVPAAGSPRPELDPPTKTLLERAESKLDAMWASSDRSAKLTVDFRNDLTMPVRLDAIGASLDTRPTPVLSLDASLPSFSMDIPAGNHVLTFAVKLSGAMKGGHYEIATKSAQAFSTRSGEPVRVTVKMYERESAPLASADQRIALDFVVKRASVAP